MLHVLSLLSHYSEVSCFALPYIFYMMLRPLHLGDTEAAPWNETYEMLSPSESSFTLFEVLVTMKSKSNREL